ncbi:NAD(P)-dependent oxidoreductase [Limosilactobacillus secaliphilus]|uniref:2-hydroxy-3-oxopropionate reductase n=1 Tax=Limosilactobacillus secaliphilus TaxID=396268 RepID=A0A0R2I942_9LACO|nr:NAD(P)-dependent oxidoreductase [Limosilactobacillus secaliphilus]KRN58892.1 2-hydroxy-3-oxopropionate reductase [Limosilactobacillus secaliphilus]
MKIGFIGTGVMGTGIVNNLLKHGEQVTVYNRTKAHAQSVLDQGAQWADSPAALTQNNDVIMTMVGFPKDVEEVYFGDEGIFKTAHSGQYLIDMTTSSPDLDQKIAQAADKLGAHALDTPVSGGDIGAKNGQLTVMVGGEKADLTSLKSLFAEFSKEVHYFGPAGAGQNAKMANQIMIAGTMTGMTEALVYAKAAGLDLKQVMETLQGGAAENFSMGSYGPRILKGDYTPGFFAKHFLKDLRIALRTAEALQLDLPATKQAKALYETLVDQRGLGDEGTQALIKLWWTKQD